jgi:hypothetical protein
MPNRLWSANEIAAQLLPGTAFDTANAFAISHVSAAIENIAEWKLANGRSSRIDLDVIVREIKEMAMSWQSKDDIVRRLQTWKNKAFACKWVLPSFNFNESRFQATGSDISNEVQN